MVDVLKEFKVEINERQGHFIIADGCIEAIKEAYGKYVGEGGVRGIDEKDVTKVTCEYLRVV